MFIPDFVKKGNVVMKWVKLKFLNMWTKVKSAR